MKLLITETIWWGWDNPGEKTKDFEYDVKKLKLWLKTVASREEGDKKEISFAFRVLSKKADSLKIKVYGSHLSYNGEPVPCTITLSKNKGQLIKTISKDGGREYSILLK